MNWLNDFISFIFPRLCIGCQDSLLHHEQILCSKCKFELPQTHFIGLNENPVSKLFYGRITFQQASSYLEFEKGNLTQKLLHELKYKNNLELGRFAGKLMGKAILKRDAYPGIQAIIPIPLHWRKKKKRGYNQSEYLALGIADELKIPMLTNVLIRNKFTGTQTKKKRYDRWENVRSVFQIKKELPKGIRHVLLVDDVVTTGATLESCGRVLLEKEGLKISMISLARSG